MSSAASLALLACGTELPPEPLPEPVACHTVVVTELGDTIHFKRVLDPGIHLNYVVESWTEGDCGDYES